MIVCGVKKKASRCGARGAGAEGWPRASRRWGVPASRTVFPEPFLPTILRGRRGACSWARACRDAQKAGCS